MMCWLCNRELKPGERSRHHMVAYYPDPGIAGHHPECNVPVVVIFLPCWCAKLNEQFANGELTSEELHALWTGETR